MSKVLIVYGSTHGQSEKIASYIGDELKELGHGVEVYDSKNTPQHMDFSDFDAVIVGASVHAGGYQRSLRSWVKKNVSALRKKPAAFYSVCLGILEEDEKVRNQEWKFAEDFLKKNDWHPMFRTVFAGALPYSKYNWFLKRIMRNISKRAGGDTDMTRDYEYTDWNQVRKFALDFSATLVTGNQKGTA